MRGIKEFPKEILADQDLVELLLPALRADIEALETFVHTGRAKIGCPISVYGGEADPTVSLADLQAWNKEASAPCDIRLFAGGHFYINTQAKASAGRRVGKTRPGVKPVSGCWRREVARPVPTLWDLNGGPFEFHFC